MAERDKPYHKFEALHRMQDQAIQKARNSGPHESAGSGIVMVAGGPRCFTSAYVAISVLRRVHNCTLPIQIWYLGPAEMSPEMMRLLEPLDVELVDAFEVRKQHPMRQLSGWECKSYAMLHSPFRHVILLDADNVALTDPAFLLSEPEFKRTGALFWPDIMTLPQSSPIWEMCRVPYRREPEIESGQIVIDKERCWVPLHLAVHFNAWSDIYYQYVVGDKETFHMAWRQLDQDYAMPTKQAQILLGTVSTPAGEERFGRGLTQFDFQGVGIFHHRTGSDWVLLGENRRLGHTAIEDQCLEFLDDLRRQWDGRIGNDPPVDSRIDGLDVIGTRRYLYRRVGFDERVIEFETDGRIVFGARDNERRWRIEADGSPQTLVISREDADMVMLTPDDDGAWRGSWLYYEKTPVELIPIGPEPPAG